jgi:hypothetical protein
MRIANRTLIETTESGNREWNPANANSAPEIHKDLELRRDGPEDDLEL